MRVIIVISLIIPSLVNAAGQGSFLFRNHVFEVDAPIFDSEGNRLEGPRYRAALFAGLDQGSLQFLAETPFLTGVDAGYFSGGTVIAPGEIPAGALTWVQVTAWDMSLGASFEAVKSLGLGGYGESIPFQVVTGGPFDVRFVKIAWP